MDVIDRNGSSEDYYPLGSRLVLYIITNVSEKPSVSINPQDGCSRCLRNVGINQTTRRRIQEDVVTLVGI
jgi:hypothetical protein